MILLKFISNYHLNFSKELYVEHKSVNTSHEKDILKIHYFALCNANHLHY